jgi:hypothetical protein
MHYWFVYRRRDSTADDLSWERYQLETNTREFCTVCEV